MQVSATMKFARISPLKARIIANEVRGCHIEKAMDILKFSNKKASTLIRKVLASAIANAENNMAVDIDDLHIESIYVNEGSRLKRFHARARGRGNQILKRTSHITVTVADNSEEAN